MLMPYKSIIKFDFFIEILDNYEMIRVSNVVYVIEFENGIKVGWARELNSRLNDYIYPWTVPIKSVHYVQTPFPQYVESKIKARLRHKFNHSWSTEFIAGGNLEEVLNELRRVMHHRPQHIQGSKFSYKVEKLERSFIPRIQVRYPSKNFK